jgi:hypothetical protein
VREALGELAGAAKEGLLALSVGVGLEVLHELIEAEVDDVVGLNGRHIPDRSVVGHGRDNDGLVAQSEADNNGDLQAHSWRDPETGDNTIAGMHLRIIRRPHRRSVPADG